MIVRPVMHTYEADNLIGLRIDEGRLEFIAVLGHGAEGDVLLARNVAPPGLSGVYQMEFYVSMVCTCPSPSSFPFPCYLTTRS